MIYIYEDDCGGPHGEAGKDEQCSLSGAIEYDGGIDFGSTARGGFIRLDNVDIYDKQMISGHGERLLDANVAQRLREPFGKSPTHCLNSKKPRSRRFGLHLEVTATRSIFTGRR